MNKYKDLPEMLHEWYLEAVTKLDPNNYNPQAFVPWDELNDQQKYIDTYIANKIKATFLVQPTKTKIVPCQCPDKNIHDFNCLNFMY